MNAKSQKIEKDAETGTARLPTPSDATPVHAEPIGAPSPPPAVEPDRRLSMLAWAVAAVLFLFNRKIGLVFFVILLVFRQYPTFSLKSLPGKIGSLYRKNRS